MFVWVEVFALIVGFLCACGVRRLYDLRRVCLYFASILPLFCPLLSSFVLFLVLYFVLLLLCLPFFLPLCSCFYLFSCFPRLVLLAAWLLLLVLSSLFVGCCCFFFPYGCMRKKKGRKVFLRPLLSCCVLLYLVAALYSSYSSGVSPFIS